MCACQVEDQLCEKYWFDPGKQFIHCAVQKLASLEIPISVFFMRAPSHSCVWLVAAFRSSKFTFLSICESSHNSSQCSHTCLAWLSHILKQQPGKCWVCLLHFDYNMIERGDQIYIGCMVIHISYMTILKTPKSQRDLCSRQKLL